MEGDDRVGRGSRWLGAGMRLVTRQGLVVHVICMLAKSWQNVQMSNILKNCVVSQHFVQNRHKICLLNLCQVENQGQTHPHKGEQTSKESFASLLPFLCKK